MLAYASLWHTAHRYAYLNRSGRRDLASDFAWRIFRDDFNIFSNAPTRLRGWRIRPDRFAHILGESRNAFRLCDLNSIKPWSGSGIFGSCLRVCWACAERGYHTVLMSLNLIERCPVHGEQLRAVCFCGKPFDPLSRALAESPGQCGECGVHFLFQNSMRRPAMVSDEIGKWRELGKWVEITCQWVEAPALPEGTQLRREILCLEAQRWSNVLATRVPRAVTLSCGRLASEFVERVATCGLRMPLPQTQEQRWQRRASGGGAVYSALSRHLRRHAFSGRFSGIARRFHDLPDADDVLHLLQRDDQARDAWTAILWTMHVEARDGPRDRPRLDERYLEGLRARVATPDERSWTRPFARWIEMHAAEISLLTLWRALTGLVEEMIKTADVRWGRCLVDIAAQRHWVATATAESRRRAQGEPSSAMTFIGMLPDGDRPWFLSERRTKSERIKEWCLVQAQRWTQLQSFASGEGSRPESVQPGRQGGIKRHRLLGVSGTVWFFLGANGDRWIARLVDGTSHSTGASPRAAIDALRTTVRRAQSRPLSGDLALTKEDSVEMRHPHAESSRSLGTTRRSAAEEAWRADPLTPFTAYVTSEQFMVDGRGRRAVYLGRKVSGRTLAQYTAMFDKFVTYLEQVSTLRERGASSSSILDATPADVHQFVCDTFANASKVTCKRYVRLLERLYEHLMRQTLVVTNPVRDWIDQGRKEHGGQVSVGHDSSLAAAPGPDMTWRLFDWLYRQGVEAMRRCDWRGFRDAVMCSVGLGTGLRHHELVHLQVGQIKVDPNAPRSRRIEIEFYAPNTGRTHTVPANPECVDLLEIWLRHRFEIGFARPTYRHPEGWVHRISGPYVFPSRIMAHRGREFRNEVGLLSTAALFLGFAALADRAVAQGVLTKETRWVLGEGATGLRRAYLLSEFAAGTTAYQLADRLGLRPEGIANYWAKWSRLTLV